MVILPAIDLLDGKVVRLHQGRYDAVTVYDADPVARARSFAAQGAELLHVVDLEGAKVGRCVQAALVAEIARAFGGPVQVGGGVRTREAFESYASAGATRVVLGTAAVREPELVLALCKDFPDRVVLAVDAKDGFVATDGWTETSTRTAVEVANTFTAARPWGVLYTDVSRDGTRSGPNVEATARLAKETGLRVIASGGIASLDDLRALASHPGIAAAIVGRALYDGAFTLAEAIAQVSQP